VPQHGSGNYDKRGKPGASGKKGFLFPAVSIIIASVSTGLAAWSKRVDGIF